MYKIYINDRPLILATAPEVVKLSKIGNEHNLIARYPGKKKFLHNYIDTLEKNTEMQSITIYSTNYEKLVKDFEALYTVVDAAGGVVYNTERKILTIYRLGYWDLPKGKLEVNEDAAAGAMREVMEETGLTKPAVGPLVCRSFHTYTHKKKRILKITKWYLMTATQERLFPQHEEDIETVMWVAPETFLTKFRPIYNSIKDVVVNAMELTNDW